jgi:hypothetical protein
VRPKADEALGVVSNLVDAAYERGSVIDEIPEERWATQWQSFLYGRLLDRSSPGGRLAERMEVAVGQLSPKLYSREITKWKTSRSDVKNALRGTWADSVVIGAVVGDAKELRPLVEKHFPSYRTVEIPYRESIPLAHLRVGAARARRTEGSSTGVAATRRDGWARALRVHPPPPWPSGYGMVVVVEVVVVGDSVVVVVGGSVVVPPGIVVVEPPSVVVGGGSVVVLAGVVVEGPGSVVVGTVAPQASAHT